MQIKTTVGHFNTSPEVLFDFLSKAENLPKWATLFCASITKQDEIYLVTTPDGQEIFFDIESNAEHGTIDMSLGPTKDQLWRGPHRVASDNLGGSLFIFTLIQAPGQPDEAFEAGCQGLVKEFEVIRSLLD